MSKLILQVELKSNTTQNSDCREDYYFNDNLIGE